MSHLETVLADADARIEGYKKTMALTIRAAGGGGGVNPSGIFGGGAGPAGTGSFGGDSYREMSQAQAQLRAFRGHVYSAIRPIATRIAGQEIRVGIKRAAKAASPAGPGTAGSGPRRQKTISLADTSLILKNFSLQTKELSEGIDILESHAILESLEKPNDLMMQWHLIWVTVATIELAGKAFWWLYDDPKRDGRLTYWPTPPHWVRRNDRRDIWPWADWLVQPPGSSEPFPVAGQDMCYFYYPDPYDPNLSLSPVQTQATSIIIDEKLQQSQNATYDNGGKPGMLLKVGRVKDAMGKAMDQRHLLTPEQRLQLVNAVKLAYAGVLKHGEPMIVDGLIEEAMPWTRAATEMDWLDSERSKERRIYKGIGTNPVSAGEIEGVNYASSAVADKHLCDNKVNPLITMISQTATSVVAPRFAGGDGVAGSPGSGRLLVWLDKAVPNNDELELSKYEFAAAAGCVKKNEVREYVGLKPLEKDEGGDDFVEMKPQKPDMGDGGAGGGSGAAGGGVVGGGGRKPKNPAGGAARRPAVGRGPAGGGGGGNGGGSDGGGRKRRGR